MGNDIGSFIPPILFFIALYVGWRILQGGVKTAIYTKAAIPGTEMLTSLSPTADIVRIKHSSVAFDPKQRLLGLADGRSKFVISWDDITQWKYESVHSENSGRLLA